MQTLTPNAPRHVGRIFTGRLAAVGLAAVVVTTALNVLIGYLAVTFLDISSLFFPLNGYATIVPFTVIGVACAVVAYAIITHRFRDNPVRSFLWIALAALVLSFIPDLSLLVFAVPGATAVSVGVLMLMHVAAFVVSVGALVVFVSPAKRATPSTS